MWSAANSYRQNEPAATEDLFKEIETAFKEDEDVLVAQDASLRRLVLQLPFPQVSESMGNHDSKIVDAAGVD